MVKEGLEVEKDEYKKECDRKNEKENQLIDRKVFWFLAPEAGLKKDVGNKQDDATEGKKQEELKKNKRDRNQRFSQYNEIDFVDGRGFGGEHDGNEDEIFPQLLPEKSVALFFSGDDCFVLGNQQHFFNFWLDGDTDQPRTQVQGFELPVVQRGSFERQDETAFALGAGRLQDLGLLMVKMVKHGESSKCYNYTDQADRFQSSVHLSLINRQWRYIIRKSAEVLFHFGILLDFSEKFKGFAPEAKPVPANLEMI